MTSTHVDHRMDTLQARALDVLRQQAPCAATERLQQAMHHSLLAPSKQIRAMLCYAAGLSNGADLNTLDAPALAIEAIHTYSLIHDDLPAMDNADQRRGQASCHVAFDEAHAILAGDALLTWAFEHLAQTDSLSHAQRCAMITLLAKAAGPQGMVAGQSMDLINDAKQIEQCHRLKTGALFQAALQLGCIAADVSWSGTWQALADTLGLAYQLQDDLLDMTASSEALGKPSQLDQQNHKHTMGQSLGIELAEQQLQAYRQRMRDLLDQLGQHDSWLSTVIEQAIPHA